MADEPQVLPCPFCGEDASWSDTRPFRNIGDDLVYQLGCSNGSCHIGPYSHVFKTKAKAIAAWNTRA